MGTSLSNIAELLAGMLNIVWPKTCLSSLDPELQNVEYVQKRTIEKILQTFLQAV